MQQFLIKLILSIFKCIFKSSKPTAEDGQGAGELEKNLRDKIKEDGWDE